MLFGPTLAANNGLTAFWPVVRHWPNIGKQPVKNFTQCIASANQIAAWYYVAIV